MSASKPGDIRPKGTVPCRLGSFFQAAPPAPELGSYRKIQSTSKLALFIGGPKEADHEGSPQMADPQIGTILFMAQRVQRFRAGRASRRKPTSHYSDHGQKHRHQNEGRRIMRAHPIENAGEDLR